MPDILHKLPTFPHEVFSSSLLGIHIFIFMYTLSHWSINKYEYKFSAYSRKYFDRPLPGLETYNIEF